MNNKENTIELEKVDQVEDLEDMGQAVDERFVELELIKEETRMEKEIELEDEIYSDNENFHKGINDGLYYAGYITSLTNAGIPLDKAYELTLNAQTGKLNVELEKIKLEEVKEQAIQVQNQML